MHEADLSILRHFAGIGDVTIALLRRLREDWLDRPLPGGDGWTVRTAFLHIAAGQCGWLRGLGEGGGSVDPDVPLDKAAVERTLLDARRRMLEFFGPRMDARWPTEHAETPHVGRDIVLYLTAHEVHHRGTLVRALWEWDMKDLPFEPRDQPLERDPLEGCLP
jgi:uncharacterized damage-inducible protein DinB